jgi:hypothetical protein
LSHCLFGQTRTVSGRVISEDFEILPVVKIYNSDTILLGTTDNEGRFKIELLPETDTLLFRSSICCWEWKTIRANYSCDNLDIILMFDMIYDFMSSRKIDRLRMKRFKKLCDLHKLAFEKGVFVTDKPCYEQYFSSNK